MGNTSSMLHTNMVPSSLAQARRRPSSSNVLMTFELHLGHELEKFLGLSPPELEDRSGLPTRGVFQQPADIQVASAKTLDCASQAAISRPVARSTIRVRA